MQTTDTVYQPLRGRFAEQIGGENIKRSEKLQTRLAFGRTQQKSDLS